MVETALEHRDAHRIERHRQRSVTDGKGAADLVEVRHTKLSELDARRRVQQGEDPDESLVGMDARIGRPTAEDPALLGETQGLAAEAPPRDARHVAGRVDKDELVLPGPPEELTGGLEPATSVGRTLPEERLDVADFDG